MWGCFESNREFIKNEYKDSSRNIKCGMNEADLIGGCEILIKSQINEPRSIQKAKLFEYILENAEIEICPYDFFADKINHSNLISEQRDKWRIEIEETKINKLVDKNAAACKNLAYTGEVDFSHTAPDWKNVLDFGIAGILDRIKKYAQKPNLTEKQRVFYKSCEIEYSAIITYMKRMSALAKSNAEINPNLELLAKTLDNLCVATPKTLHEAMELTRASAVVIFPQDYDTIHTLGDSLSETRLFLFPCHRVPQIFLYQKFFRIFCYSF
jgi:hypothetical protein